MDPRNGQVGGRDSLVLLILLAVFLLFDPVRSWWVQAAPHWLWPYGIWAGLIALTWLTYRQRGRDRREL